MKKTLSILLAGIMVIPMFGGFLPKRNVVNRPQDRDRVIEIEGPVEIIRGPVYEIPPIIKAPIGDK